MWSPGNPYFLDITARIHIFAIVQFETVNIAPPPRSQPRADAAPLTPSPHPQLSPRHESLLAALLKLDFNLRALAESHNLSAVELLDFTHDPAVRHAVGTLTSFANFIAPLARAAERRTALEAITRTLHASTDEREIRLAANAILNYGRPQPARPRSTSSRATGLGGSRPQPVRGHVTDSGPRVPHPVHGLATGFGRSGQKPVRSTPPRAAHPPTTSAAAPASPQAPAAPIHSAASVPSAPSAQSTLSQSPARGQTRFPSRSRPPAAALRTPRAQHRKATVSHRHLTPRFTLRCRSLALADTS